MGRALRRNVGLTCAHCLGTIWQARRDELDAGTRKPGAVGRLLVGRRIGSRPKDGTKAPATGSFELLWSRAADLPPELRSWLKQRALAAIKQWLEWGVLELADLKSYTSSTVSAPSSFSLGAGVRPIEAMANRTPAVMTAGGTYGGTKKANW